MELSNEEIEHLKVLLKQPIHTKHFEMYDKYHTKITGKANQSTCNKCAMRKMVRLLKNYIKKF